MDLAALRRAYQALPFDISDAAQTPFEQFSSWVEEMVAASTELEVNAAVLATADGRGRPSARHVLVKGADIRGFAFFTNYASRKADELAANPWASLVFAWSPVARQVIAEGPVERLGAPESDAYFASRPRDSQLAAWASPQSRPLPDRAALDAAFAASEARFADAPVPRPPGWGGFRLRPVRVEFWQGRPSRLHDRIVYLAEGGTWRRERLAP
ncbi:MAG: pyridoxamine 5'-phosphate oxidase [Acidimicrobiia bacterium]|nr:pyridoxamine 5'-phosphate oxidase [Acidimicrobiia bacterium]